MNGRDNMTCDVFSNNKEKAIEKLEEIKNIKDNLIRMRKSSNELIYEFEDGECWHWRQINEKQRGIRSCKAWIDKDINKRDLNYIVFPCLYHCKNEDIFYF